MGDSVYRGTFILKLVLLVASTIILIGSYDERPATFLHTWLSVLVLVLLLEVFLSMFIRIVRLIHFLQLFEFVWQCIGLNEVYHSLYDE
jgi:hypothetical protein